MRAADVKPGLVLDHDECVVVWGALFQVLNDEHHSRDATWQARKRLYARLCERQGIVCEEPLALNKDAESLGNVILRLRDKSAARRAEAAVLGTGDAA